MQANKFRLFIENILVYGLGGIISKIIPFIMVPIITRIMPSTEYFGISDLSHTLVQLCSALAIFGMYDAMYRMFFEKEDINYKKDICSTTIAFTTITTSVVFIVMILFRYSIAKFFFGDETYTNVVYLSAMATLVSATNSIISAPTRMQNKRKVFLVTNTVSPILSYSISIPLLLRGYYVIALPLAAVLSGITMEASFFVLNNKWFQLKRFNINLLKQLLIIAVPLLPNFLIYWVFNSCDKIMITNLLGLGEAGIYSVGSKLGHASQLIYTAFAGGWQFFAFSTMKDKNQVKSNSMIFEYLGIISYIATAFIAALCYALFRILFKDIYLQGYIIAPYLFLAPLLQMLFQVVSNQFLVIKKTWPNLLILASGAILNILINYYLIPKIGIEGAALATLIGYAVSVVICVIVLLNMKLIEVPIRFVYASCFMMVYLMIWRLLFSSNTLVGTVAAILFTCLLIIIYRKEWNMLFTMIKKNKHER